MCPLSLLRPLEPTSENPTRPRMTITVGHMDIRLDWPTQVPTAPRKILDTRMKPPRTTSWELKIGDFFMNYLNCTPSPQSNSMTLFDSVCTALFLIASAHCKNKQIAQSPLEVHLSNGAVIASTHTATFDLLSFPTASRQYHKLPGLAQHSLLSVGQMCDIGCAITFTANLRSPSNMVQQQF
jgi:hypothetical protein